VKAPPLGSLCKNLTKRSPTEFLPTRELFQRVCAGQPQADSAKGPLWACTLDLRSVEIYPRSLLQRAYQNTSYRELADRSTDLIKTFCQETSCRRKFRSQTSDNMDR